MDHYIKGSSNIILRFLLCIVLGLQCCNLQAQNFQLQTGYVRLTVNNKGFITSIVDINTKKEYCPAGLSSALMSLTRDHHFILPQHAAYNSKTKQITLKYTNGAVAKIKADQKAQYIRFQLLSLSPRNEINNIVWGPYKTSISKTIGDVLGVVRSDNFAIGLLGLNDNTTQGPPTDGDMSFMYYYIHSPDPVKYPLPANLKEGQTFTIGGDGKNDVAFYAHPEEYYRMNYGNGATLEPAFGSTICMHSRDRRREQMIRFPVLPDGLNGKANSARSQLVLPTDAGFIGSSVAFFACPDSLGLSTIEKVVVNEGLPHPEIDGKWIKDPKAYKPDIAWSGVHDSLINYAKRLNIHGIQDEGMGEYYPNPANRWAGKTIRFNNSPTMSIPEYGALMQKNGIRYGLHTLCEFLQPGSNSDVAPVPSDSLAIVQRSVIAAGISEADTVIKVVDKAYFNEYGGWEGNETNVLKLGKELIEYNGITQTAPYTFLHIKRGLYGTHKSSYKKGTTIVKLQPNCYHGFAPDMDLQEKYADYYGKWLAEGGMDYIDFDGLESCIYQGQGQYSFKRFFRKLFETYKENGGKYLRVMGSAIGEGDWHYMSVGNVGGGNNMFDPVLNKWGIEGKDMRYVFQSSYLPATFGIINLNSDWTVADAENLEAKSLGWDATYMLGLSQRIVENTAQKDEIFKAYNLWEEARASNVFTRAIKDKLKNLDYKFHLEKLGARSFLMFPIKENRFRDQSLGVTKKSFSVSNEFKEQTLDVAIQISAPKNVSIEGIKITLPGGQVLLVNEKLSNGDFIIYKAGVCYTADKNRKRINEIAAGTSAMLSNGVSVIGIGASQPVSTDVKFELVVSTIGEGQKI